MKRFRQHIAYKSLLVIVVMLIIFSVIIALAGYNGFTKALLQQYGDGAFRTAESASLIIDANRMDRYEESGGETVEYRVALSRLDQLCNTTGATFIYVIEPDLTDYGHIRFIFSTKNKDSDFELYPFGYLRETTNEDYKVKYRALIEGRSEQELVVRDQGYIETQPHITAMIPLVDYEGNVPAILCVQRQMDVLLQARNSYVNKIILGMLILVASVIVAQILYLNNVVLKPVLKIAGEANRFAKENVPAERKLKDTIRNEDEIGLLAESVDRMEEQVRDYIENLTAVTAENERISTEMSLASRIQSSALPHEFPPFPDRQDFDIFATMHPAKEVGGDFFEFFLIDDDHLCVVMADVSGKGVPGALFMMISKIILNSCAMQGLTPAGILTKANEAICDNNQEEMFVTVWVGILELSTGHLKAANAGHEYPVFKTKDGPYELYKDKHGFVLGGFEDSTYKEYELDIEPGAKIFLYTDGVPEATDPDNEMFGTGRLIEALNEDPDAGPEETLENVRKAVESFVRGSEPFDDVTMLCLEYRG